MVSVQVQAVSDLIENGCQVTCRDKDGWTPLHHACRHDHAEVVTQLISHGADVNAKNKVRGWAYAQMSREC